MVLFFLNVRIAGIFRKLYGFLKKCTDCTDFFFEKCTDCTDFFSKIVRIFSENVRIFFENCTDFFLKMHGFLYGFFQKFLATLNMPPRYLIWIYETLYFSDLNHCFLGLMNAQQQSQSCENLLSENFRLFNIRFLSAKLDNNNFGIFIENISSKKKRLS